MDHVQITAHYHGPVRLLGARITARALGKQKTVPYDHGATDPYLVAAEALCDILGLSKSRLTYVDTHNAPGNIYNTYRVEITHD